jgi:hypothetical protein
MRGQVDRDTPGRRRPRRRQPGQATMGPLPAVVSPTGSAAVPLMRACDLDSFGHLIVPEHADSLALHQDQPDHHHQSSRAGPTDQSRLSPRSVAAPLHFKKKHKQQPQQQQQRVQQSHVYPITPTASASSHATTSSSNSSLERTTRTTTTPHPSALEQDDWVTARRRQRRNRPRPYPAATTTTRVHRSVTTEETHLVEPDNVAGDRSSLSSNNSHSESDDTYWSCHRCTLHNPGTTTACQACNFKQRTTTTATIAAITSPTNTTTSATRRRRIRSPDPVRRERLVPEQRRAPALFQSDTRNSASHAATISFAPTFQPPPPSPQNSASHYIMRGTLVGGLLGAYLQGNSSGLVTFGAVVLEVAMSGAIGGALLYDVLEQQRARGLGNSASNNSRSQQDADNDDDPMVAFIMRSMETSSRQSSYERVVTGTETENIYNSITGTENIYNSINNSINNTAAARERDIRSLPLAEVHDPNNLPEDCRCCSICLDSFETGTFRKTLPCLHGFHDVCVDKWLRTNGACPICKHRIDG